VPEVVGSGKKVEFPFSLRVDQAGSLAGKVELFYGGPDETEVKDLNPANDTAKILVNATGNGGGEGGGGSLPITGANAGLIAGIGGVLLAAGAAGFVVARRRKTRFVA
jgi:LPXTG-motif cell wall-anchored protein